MKNDKQNEILDYIQNKLNNEGHSPSIREIAEAVNLKSPSSVQHHLNNLVKKIVIKNAKTNIKTVLMPANLIYSGIKCRS